jgi:rhodanese-related sulfurtransferase
MTVIPSLAIKALRGALLLSLLACIPAAFAWVKLKDAAETLLPDELTMHDPKVSAKDVVWVDARSQDAYDEGHVTGAILLNDDKWDTLLGNLFAAWQPERPIIVYCSAGCEASHHVADRLRDLGLEPIYVLKGGYDAWKQNQPKASL